MAPPAGGVVPERRPRARRTLLSVANVGGSGAARRQRVWDGRALPGPTGPRPHREGVAAGTCFVGQAGGTRSLGSAEAAVGTRRPRQAAPPDPARALNDGASSTRSAKLSSAAPTPDARLRAARRRPAHGRAPEAQGRLGEASAGDCSGDAGRVARTGPPEGGKRSRTTFTHPHRQPQGARQPEPLLRRSQHDLPRRDDKTITSTLTDGCTAPTGRQRNLRRACAAMAAGGSLSGAMGEAVARPHALRATGGSPATPKIVRDPPRRLGRPPPTTLHAPRSAWPRRCVPPSGARVDPAARAAPGRSPPAARGPRRGAVSLQPLEHGGLKVLPEGEDGGCVEHRAPAVAAEVDPAGLVV